MPVSIYMHEQFIQANHRGCCRTVNWRTFSATYVRKRKMQGKKQYLDQEVTRCRHSERVPPHNPSQRLAKLVNWLFLSGKTRALYRHPGQPLLDPVVFCKLVLVGRLANLVSNRRLVEHCARRLDSCFFWATQWTRTCPGTRLAAAPVSSSRPPCASA